MNIENVIVKTSDWRMSDLELLFDDEDIWFTEARDIPALMKEMGIFKSTSEARRAGRVGPIPNGFTFSFKASKKRSLWIWNPTE